MFLSNYGMDFFGEPVLIRRRTKLPPTGRISKRPKCLMKFSTLKSPTKDEDEWKLQMKLVILPTKPADLKVNLLFVFCEWQIVNK